MWSRIGRARPRRAPIALLGAAIALGGCKSSPPKTAAGAAKLEAPRFSKRIDAGELLPGDLDLVVRLDLARMRDALGPIATDQLAARALEKRGDPMLKGLLSCADVVWIGLRAASIESEDHIAIVEGKDCDVRADTAEWKRVKSANGDLTIFDRIKPADRGGTGRVILVSDRAVMLVSPAEVASVDRVLRDGPDKKRGEPKAEGVLSLDLRGQRLPPELEKKYPSIAAIIAGIDRVRANTQLADRGLELEAEIQGRSPHDAERALKFLAALRDNVESDGARLLLASVKLELVESTVRVRWTVPSKVVLGLLTDAADKAEH